MEMPTCKAKGEMGSTLGEKQRRGRDIARCLQTPTTRRRRRRGGMERRDAGKIQLGCKRTRGWSFQQFARCGLNICPQMRNKGLSIAPRLPYTHSNTAQRTRKVLHRTVLFSRCVFRKLAFITTIKTDKAIFNVSDDTCLCNQYNDYIKWEN